MLGETSEGGVNANVTGWWWGLLEELSTGCHATPSLRAAVVVEQLKAAAVRMTEATARLELGGGVA